MKIDCKKIFPFSSKKIKVIKKQFKLKIPQFVSLYFLPGFTIRVKIDLIYLTQSTKK